ncbi:hypothetical protein FOZ62_031346 [Perkinsus olseni]|uniref:Uncharacterized protein n=1 Tax=Perkinsus olseni TaxID=32597 RepID=A0A7J6S238_PEROL|nr:hypothetical protein FOZ62_031346 [Perkinsus olseni]
MGFHSGLVALLSFIAVAGALSSSKRWSGAPSDEEYERLFALQSKGVSNPNVSCVGLLANRLPLASMVHFGEGVSGCEIDSRDPLEKMQFWFSISPKDNASPGEVLRTALYDTNKTQYYSFDKRYGWFKGEVEDVSIQFGKEKNWDALKAAGLLPLDHLSQRTREILARYTAKGKNYYINTRECLYLVEAIINDPPPGYEQYKGSSQWILTETVIRK